MKTTTIFCFSVLALGFCTLLADANGKRLQYLSPEHIRQMAASQTKIEYVQWPDDVDEATDDMLQDSLVFHASKHCHFLKTQIPQKVQLPMVLFTIAADRPESVALLNVFQHISLTIHDRRRELQLKSIQNTLVKPKGWVKSFSSRASAGMSVVNMINSVPDHQYVYIDPSHFFTTSVWDQAICATGNRNAYDVRIVAVKRRLSDIVSGILERTTAEVFNDWYYRISDTNVHAIRELYRLRNATREEKTEGMNAVAYAVDVQAQIDLFRKRFPSIQVVEVEYNDLHTVDGVLSFLERLNLQISEEDRQKIEKSFAKEFSGGGKSKIDISGLIDEFIRLCEELDIPLPQLSL